MAETEPAPNPWDDVETVLVIDNLKMIFERSVANEQTWPMVWSLINRFVDEIDELTHSETGKQATAFLAGIEWTTTREFEELKAELERTRRERDRYLHSAENYHHLLTNARTDLDHYRVALVHHHCEYTFAKGATCPACGMALRPEDASLAVRRGWPAPRSGW
jgi:hypothetical protein